MRKTNPEAAGLAFEDVRFASSAGYLWLRGWFLPSGRSARTVIIAHGYNNHRLGEVPSLSLAAALVEQGYNVLAFDFRASGHSDGNLVSLGQYERYDLLGALDYLDSPLLWPRASCRGGRLLYGRGGRHRGRDACRIADRRDGRRQRLRRHGCLPAGEPLQVEPPARLPLQPADHRADAPAHRDRPADRPAR